MRIFLWAMLWGSLSMNSHAATTGTIEVQSIAEVEVIGQNGEREMRRAPINHAAPGMVVVFTTTFQNTSRKPAGNIVINNPIPNDTEYKAGSAFGDNTEITFSIDGGRSFATADQLLVPTANGKNRIAPPKAYTHIRWVYKNRLESGERGAVGFRAAIK